MEHGKKGKASEAVPSSDGPPQALQKAAQERPKKVDVLACWLPES